MIQSDLKRVSNIIYGRWHYENKTYTARELEVEFKRISKIPFDDDSVFKVILTSNTEILYTREKLMALSQERIIIKIS